MPPHEGVLGILKPLGGGDPIPLEKPELIVGRRPTCDVVIDFENVSGKHCMLRLINGVWHVRDVGSSNGTTVNGQKIASDHSVMPDDEVGIATHLFTIDYEPSGPEALLNHSKFMDEEVVEVRKRHSLMELAGLETDEKPKRKRPTKPPERIIRLSADEGEFEDALPEHVKAAPKPEVPAASDDDFFKLIEEDVKPPQP